MPVKKIIFACIVLQGLFFAGLKAQEWEVPADKATETAPVVFDNTLIESGGALYKKHCQSCHGEPGKNNPAALNPSPGDIASEKFVKDSDGALFYKITAGRGLMPRFEQVLKEEERWQVIAFIRSFHPGYKQPEISVDEGIGHKRVRLNATVKDKNTIQVLAYTLQQGDTVPAEQVRLQLFVKRYFGLLPLDEKRTTDASGRAEFVTGDTLRADTAGFITFVIKTTDNSAETEIQSETGIKNTYPSLRAERALWNTIQMAPLWLLFTYLIAVIAVWGTLGYIVLQLYKLFKSNKSVSSINNQ